MRQKRTYCVCSGTTVYGAIIESLLKLEKDPQYTTQLDVLGDYEEELQVRGGASGARTSFR